MEAQSLQALPHCIKQPGWLFTDGDVEAVDEGDILGNLRAEPDGPHLREAHAVSEYELLQPT